MAKDKYENLDEEFKAKVRAMKDDMEIKKCIGEWVIANAVFQASQEDDEKFQKAKTVYDELGAPYKESAARTKLQVAFCREELKSRGKTVPVSVLV